MAALLMGLSKTRLTAMIISIIFAAICVGASIFSFWKTYIRGPTPISVNYHFTRKCNFECGFCFHTSTTADMLSLHEAKRGILLVKDAGMRKINFAGGEPFLYPDFLGELIVYSKNIGVEAVSIVSNGSKITSSFMRQYGSYIDVLAVSCDSFASETNKVIGRKSGAPLRRLLQIRSWCSQYGIKFKVNTVVNRFNYREDMNDSIGQLQPFRWKCFQVLLDESENNGNGTLRDARPFLISKAEYETFIANHAGQPSLIQEPNDIMRSSYLILDEYMRFLGKEGDYAVSNSILNVGVQKALQSVLWRQSRFYQRDGVYDWKSSRAGLIQEKPSALNW